MTDIVALARTRDDLHQVIVHVLSRRRKQRVGRIGLRVTPGGIGLPPTGDDSEVLRLDPLSLVHERDTADGARGTRTALDGATLAGLGEAAGVDLDAALDVGHDTPPVTDPTRPLDLDRDRLATLFSWWDLGWRAIDATLAGLGEDRSATQLQLWPEHVDVGIDLAVSDGSRVNLGASAGDGFHAEPYLYVGPWTDARPGDEGFWNAPFGAVAGRAEVLAVDDPLERAVAFYREGLDRLG